MNLKTPAMLNANPSGARPTGLPLQLRNEAARALKSLPFRFLI